MKRYKMIRTAIICAFVVMVCNISVQAYNENWFEDNDVPYGATLTNWFLEVNWSMSLWYDVGVPGDYTGNAVLRFDSQGTWYARCAVTPPGNNWFRDVRVMGLVNADASNDTSVTDLDDLNQIHQGFHGHSTAWASKGYSGMLNWEDDAVYLNLFRNGPDHIDAIPVLIPGSEVAGDCHYDFSYWLVLDVEGDTSDATANMTVSARVWESEESYYNQDAALAEISMYDPNPRPETTGDCTNGRSGLIMINPAQLYGYTAHYKHVTSVQLNEFIKGDYNGDNIVDQADYTIWADTYGQTGPALNADLMGNADGVVDQADYTVWADNYGNTPGAPNAVPEPVTMTLLTLAGLALLRRK